MSKALSYVAALVSGALLALGGVAAVAPPAHADIAITLPTAPEGDLPGINDWTCTPSASRPEPVVVVHGTFGDRRHLLERLERTLLGQGYCVFALDYGNRAINHVAESAQQLAVFVDRVLARTGADKVEMVGHSQGGMMPRYYVKFLGGAAHVDDLVGLAPSNHGTRLVTPNNPLIGAVCSSCNEQAWGSAFLSHLNAGDETPGDVSYTQIESKYDEVVVPYTSAFLAEGPNTTNVLLQKACPRLLTEHLLIPSNRVAIAYVLDAFAHAGPADPAYRPAC